MPCHPDTLRDALRQVGESAWQKAQQAGVQSLYQRQLVRGKVYAVDGSGLGDELRVVALVCVSATRPIIVAWAGTQRSGLREGQGSRGDAHTDRASLGSGRAERDQLEAFRCPLR
ncbi:MAG: hypothetical protein E6I80_29340 [Chloroflexi bacterium]|nr:MAG: hypothetical protein E6I80_29340 [Chloroflexota bacterium]